MYIYCYWEEKEEKKCPYYFRDALRILILCTNVNVLFAQYIKPLIHIETNRSAPQDVNISKHISYQQ